MVLPNQVPGITFCALLLHVASYGQVIENIRAELAGDKILIRYDLNGPPTGYGVDVQPYSSHDGFRDVLTNLTGDLINVRPGPGKSILWKPPSALDNFNGQLSFELHGEIVKDLSFVPARSHKIKRGKLTTVQWQGGRPADNVRIEFQSNSGDRVWSSTIRNEHRVEWLLPKKTKKGSGYTYKITSTDGAVVSNTYTVKPKVKRVWFFLPPLIAGGVWYFFIREAPLPPPPGIPEPD